MFTEFICETTETDCSPKVDRKASVFVVVLGEKAGKVLRQVRVFQPFVQFDKSHVLGEFLKEDFDENTTGACGFLVVEMNVGEYSPG